MTSKKVLLYFLPIIYYLFFIVLCVYIRDVTFDNVFVGFFIYFHSFVYIIDVTFDNIFVVF